MMKDDETHTLLPVVITLASALAPGTVEALAQATAACQPDDWPTIRMQMTQVVPQSRMRAYVTALVGMWQQQAAHVAPGQVALMLRTAAATVRQMRQEQRIDLVWTGPVLVGVAMRRTDQALLDVITAAQDTLLIVSFAVYKIPAITAALIQAAQRGVTLQICIEAPEPGGQTIAYDTLAALGPQMMQHAAIYLWPRNQRPTGATGKGGALHAKCAVADGRVLLVSSANLTEYALNLNMELGVLIEGGPQPATVERQFHELIARGVLQRVRG
jgi:phosphatidylserine/phosphatidylglycerophosphate/cardiolipin synthase-like enzyme